MVWKVQTAPPQISSLCQNRKVTMPYLDPTVQSAVSWSLYGPFCNISQCSSKATWTHFKINSSIWKTVFCKISKIVRSSMEPNQCIVVYYVYGIMSNLIIFFHFPFVGLLLCSTSCGLCPVMIKWKKSSHEPVPRFCFLQRRVLTPGGCVQGLMQVTLFNMLLLFSIHQ